MKAQTYCEKHMAQQLDKLPEKDRELAWVLWSRTDDRSECDQCLYEIVNRPMNKQERNKWRIIEIRRKRGEQANKRYHARFNNDLYRAATKDRTCQYANALIDEAMALCGDPYFKLSYRNWSAAAEAFLAEFDAE